MGNELPTLRIVLNKNSSILATLAALFKAPAREAEHLHSVVEALA